MRDWLINMLSGVVLQRIKGGKFKIGDTYGAKELGLGFLSEHSNFPKNWEISTNSGIDNAFEFSSLNHNIATFYSSQQKLTLTFNGEEHLATYEHRVSVKSKPGLLLSTETIFKAQREVSINKVKGVYGGIDIWKTTYEYK